MRAALRGLGIARDQRRRRGDRRINHRRPRAKARWKCMHLPWLSRIQQLLDRLDLLPVSLSFQICDLNLHRLSKIGPFLTFQPRKELLCRAIHQFNFSGNKSVLLLTDDIIAILISDEHLNRTLALLIFQSQDVNDLFPFLLAPELNTLFNNIARKLMFGECHEIEDDEIDNSPSIFRPTMLNDVLRDIIAVLIVDEGLGASMKLLQYRGSCGLLTVLKHTLDDSAPIRVGCVFTNFPLKCIDDELNVLRRHSFDRLLHHMVTVLIFHAFHHIMLKLLDQGGLLIGQDMFQCLLRVSKGALLMPCMLIHLLDNATAVHLRG